jgi:hypothetical protein
MHMAPNYGQYRYNGRRNNMQQRSDFLHS